MILIFQKSIFWQKYIPNFKSLELWYQVCKKKKFLFFFRNWYQEAYNENGKLKENPSLTKAIVKTYGFQYLTIGFFPACSVCIYVNTIFEEHDLKNMISILKKKKNWRVKINQKSCVVCNVYQTSLVEEKKAFCLKYYYNFRTIMLGFTIDKQSR